MSVLAVILNYKSYEDLDKCLTSLLESNLPTNTKLDFYVVDAEFEKNQLHKFKKKFPSVIFNPVNNNLGVSAGYNLGFKYAVKNKYDYVLMVTPDVIIHDNTIAKLLVSIENNPKLGMVAPKILLNTYPKRIYFVKGAIDKRRKSSNHIGYLEIDTGQYDSENILLSDFVNCSIVLIRVELFRKIGYWDTSYFLYYEDIDWNIRVKRAGYTVAVNTSAEAIHDESSSVKKGSVRQEYYTTRNLLIHIKKFYPISEQLIAYILTIKELIELIPRLISNSDRKFVISKYVALVDFIIGRKGYKYIK